MGKHCGKLKSFGSAVGILLMISLFVRMLNYQFVQDFVQRCFKSQHDYSINVSRNALTSVRTFGKAQFCPGKPWKGTTYIKPKFSVEPPEEKCSRSRVVIYVYSSLFNVEKRSKLRNLTKEIFKKYSSTSIFVIGVPSPEHLKHIFITRLKKIEEEILTHEDILQIAVNDTYFNLGYKGLFALHWITKHCKDVEIIVKIDDDNLHRLPAISRKLNELFMNKTNLTNSFACGKTTKGRVLHSGALKKHWLVSKDLYNAPFYPSYCIGDCGTFFSPQVAEKILFVAKNHEIFKIDDAYISGMLRQRACVDIL